VHLKRPWRNSGNSACAIATAPCGDWIIRCRVVLSSAQAGSRPMNVEAHVTWTDGERFVANASKRPCPVIDSDRVRNSPAGPIEMVLMGSAPSHSCYCFVKSHAPFMFCAGGEGGVAHGLPVKSKNSVMSGIAASRAVSVGRLQRASMNRR